MPAMHYHLRWPDASEMRCYSPSLVIQDFFRPGARYPIADFMPQIRRATQIASDRVEAKFGFACSAALDQLRAIEAQAAAQPGGGGGEVEVLRFELPPGA